ncbi:nucleotide kinase domain-containing protein, partial [Henriciella sp.]|uniref:nucleotide kinase domain-containing protein n=1 Tax=Henriciella sp. TaxID=1968823 RepID=UPI003C756A04
PTLFGRRLQPIDCQNLFCEISKYARIAHPDVAGIANRTRIKQRYHCNRTPLERPVFPADWSLEESVDEFLSPGGETKSKRVRDQRNLFPDYSADRGPK